MGEGGFERCRPSARIGGGVQWFEWAGGGEGGRVKTEELGTTINDENSSRAGN